MVCGRIIRGTSDDTEHKIGHKIKKVRRGGKGKHKHGMQSCNVYYVNINGFKSKIGSFQKILDEQNVGILLLTETKVYSKQSIKLHGYQVFPSVRKKGLGGGLLIAVRHGLCTSMMIDEGENADFLTVKLEVCGKCIRLILVYGPQEKVPENTRETFWHNISIQVERAKLSGETVSLTGDFHAKLGTLFVPGDVHDTSTNGKYLFDLWKTQDLCLLNTQSFTHGVFTRVNNKNKSERSVIDYMFCTYDLLSNISSFHIDEMKEFTPWRQLKTGKTFTDHNAMVMKLVIPKSLKRHKVPGRQIVWDFDNPSGWDKYHKLTGTNPSLNKIWVDCENVEYSYARWEAKVNRLLHRCFRRKRVTNKPNGTFNREIRLLLKQEKEIKHQLKTSKSKPMQKGREKDLEVLSKTISKKIAQFNWELVMGSVSNGLISKEDFWKVKKKLFPKSVQIPHSILDRSGNVLTDSQNIILEYRNEMIHRLRKRLIRSDLKEFEGVVNDLCRQRLQKAKLKISAEFTLKEVQCAIEELKIGKCIDPMGFVRELFTKAGIGLVKSIVTMLNAVKKKWHIPARWAEMYITMIYKQKGSWKELENHRGIFIVVILTIIFEKVIKNRILPVLSTNMTQFQTGGAKGKGVVDNLFILRGIIDHSVYLNKPTFVTFYDIEKCFDSLWLEDCINTLWENGVQDDTIYLIYLLNAKASVTVNTPFGRAPVFELKHIVKQGTVLGPILNNCSLDTICRDGSGYQMGHTVIKPMEFVDDLADPNHNIQSASASNQIIEQIQHEKRLKFSVRKCELLVIGQVEDQCNLEVNNTTIKQVQHVKYLGDLINSQGNNCDLIKSRIDRSYGSVTELISICKEAYFGSKQIEIMLLLYRSVYLPRLIYNCESWSKLTKNDICKLQKAQRRYLRSIMEAPGSTPVAATYLELGVLPIEYEIDIRRLRFLWTILQKNYDDPVRMVYTEMLKYHFEENWANDVMKLRCKYGLSMDDASVETTGMNEWKYLIKSSVKTYALRCLTKACSENKKTQHLEFDKLNESPYLTALSPQTARIIFNQSSDILQHSQNRPTGDRWLKF